MTVTRYALSGDVSIAYQVVGEGPSDLVLIPGFVSHLEVAWEGLELARFLHRLASFQRVILFDKRGTGLSDPVAEPPTYADRVDDIRAVMDAVGSQRAALFGVSEGGALAMTFAHGHPERVSALVVYGSYGRWLQGDGYEWGRTPDRFHEFLAGVEESWGTADWWDRANPSVATDGRYRDWWARYLRLSASPAMARALLQMNSEIDVRPLLREIAVRTLVIHRTDDQWIGVGNGRYLAGNLPNATLIELPGADHPPWVGDQDAVLDAVERFLTGAIHRSRKPAFSVGAAALTRREVEIVRLAIEGETAPRIAERLFISERTVETHLANAYAKLGVQSKVELARRAHDLGI